VGLIFGSWRNRVDEKGRLFFPRGLISLFPSRWGDKADLILTRRPDQPCLVLQSAQQWEEQHADLIRLHPLSPEYATFMRYAALAQNVEWDQQFRVLLEPHIREVSGIQPNSYVLIFGCGTHVELWEEEAGKKILQGMVQSGPAFMADMMARLSQTPSSPKTGTTPELVNNK